ncbi:MAG TPA: DUF1569 domain-containing protein [Thermoanaerobaculia bacterium]
MTDDTLEQIRTQLERLRALARSAELSARNDRVSAWCLAEQVDHITKVSASIVGVLGDASAVPVSRGVNFVGRLVLLFRWIPRGVGKSPRRFVPAAAGDPADLDAALARLAQAFEALPFDTLRTSRVPLVPHPKFGGLTPPQALDFLVVHTAHHLKIIDDIVRA